MAEIHDFSRAADGLAKEIYLGLVFAQLQVLYHCHLIFTQEEEGGGMEAKVAGERGVAILIYSF